MRLTAAVLARLAVAALACALPAFAADTLIAEAPPVGPFNRLDVSGHAELILVQGEREAVTVEAAAKSHARVRVRSKDGQLTIDVGEHASWWDWLGSSGGRRPTVTVYFRTLEALKVSGAIRVTAAALQAPTLEVTASGAAALRVDALKADSFRFSGSGAVKGEFAGTANEQEVSISGAGVFRAPKLASNTAHVRVSGAGKVVVNAQRELDAAISGAGAIEYFGDPAVRHRISGAGKITRRSASEIGAIRLRAA